MREKGLFWTHRSGEKREGCLESDAENVFLTVDVHSRCHGSSVRIVGGAM